MNRLHFGMSALLIVFAGACTKSSKKSDRKQTSAPKASPMRVTASPPIPRRVATPAPRAVRPPPTPAPDPTATPSQDAGTLVDDRAAKHLKGTWRGVLIQPGSNTGVTSYSYSITFLNTAGGKLSGTSRIEIPLTPYYGEFAFTGSIRGGVITVRETKLGKKNEKPRMVWCMKQLSLTFDDETRSLKGPWHDWTGGTCPGGKVKLFFRTTRDIPASTQTIDTKKLTRRQMKKVKRGTTLILRSIRFGYSSHKLQRRTRRALRKVCQLLKAKPQLRAYIAGHTDNTGADESNMNLSERRAKAVVRHLTRCGIAKSRLKSEGFGESKPLVSNRSADGRAKNRRVAVRIH